MLICDCYRRLLNFLLWKLEFSACYSNFLFFLLKLNGNNFILLIIFSYIFVVCLYFILLFILWIKLNIHSLSDSLSDSLYTGFVRYTGLLGIYCDVDFLAGGVLPYIFRGLPHIFNKYHIFYPSKIFPLKIFSYFTSKYIHLLY